MKIDGTELGAATDFNGHYVCAPLPATTWTATASYNGYVENSARFNVTEACTTELNFSLSLAGTPNMSRSAESLVLYVLNLDTVQMDTVATFLSTDDTAKISRCNAAKLGLLERYRKGGGIRAALIVEPWRPHHPLRDSLTVTLRPDASVTAGKGFCYYRKWYPQTDVVIGPDNIIYEVTSVSAGYFDGDQTGRQKYVECRGPYPLNKWLVLKLTLFGGGTAYF